MSDARTPDWLIETQNKSWEPEIIISGITLTFVFLLPTHLYNFFAMLIQDYGVWEIVGRMQYNLCLLLLTGLKVILIIHLVLRGMWAGYVGLSYVFPDGVIAENLPEEVSKKHFLRPEEFVMQIERICSLLFSMVFTTVYFVIGFFAMFIPITLLFFTPLNPAQIKSVILFVIVPLGAVVVPVLSILMGTVWKNSRFNKWLEKLPLGQIIMMYVTNIGPVKTVLIYGVFGALIVAFVWDDMQQFSFRNKEPVEALDRPGIVALRAENFENLRDERLRIQRATLDQYRQTEGRMRLFVSHYKQDNFTVDMLKDSEDLRQKSEIGVPVDEIWVHTVHSVWIDGERVPGLQWVYTVHPETGQRGFEAMVPLKGIASGDHTLKIQKWLCEVRKDKLLDLDPWEQIPFEVVRNNEPAESTEQPEPQPTGEPVEPEQTVSQPGSAA